LIAAYVFFLLISVLHLMIYHKITNKNDGRVVKIITMCRVFKSIGWGDLLELYFFWFNSSFNTY